MNEIIIKAQNGNKKAMEAIYSSTCDELECYCLQLCGNVQDAQDLMQDTYLTAFEKLSQYRRDDNFRGWLHTIARHKLYNRIRDEKPQFFTELTDDIINAENEIYAPESYAERKDIQEILDEIISGELSESQRLTVTFYYYDEKNIHEIASELNCPEGTVKTRLYHSRKIIKDELIKRGITIGGSVVLVSAVFKAKAASFTASAASAVVVGSIIKEKAASAASKSVLTYAKGKIIAGAAAIVVAGVTAGAVYIISNNDNAKNEPPVSEISAVTDEPAVRTAVPVTKAIVSSYEAVTTSEETVTEPIVGVSEPGGEPVEYSFDSNLMKAYIPENYEVKSYFKSGNDENGYSFVENPVRESELEKRTFISSHVKELLVFRPDEFSGDEVIFMTRHIEPDEIDVNTELSELYDNVELSVSEEFMIPMDNTNSSDSPTEKAAMRYSFTADDTKGSVSGTAIIFKGNMKKTHFIVFSDCSGIRQQEYESIINSISLSFADNSWRDRYDIPDSMR